MDARFDKGFEGEALFDHARVAALRKFTGRQTESSRIRRDEG